MQDLRYVDALAPLLQALPELRPPYERLVDDWDNFGGEPPGQYIVFSDTYGTMLEVVLTLPERTPGRERLLRRTIDFGERMLQSQDRAVADLAIDALAERLDGHPAGRAVAEQFGGPRLKQWFASYSSDDWQRPLPDEIIDLWGVRREITSLLPATPPHEIPGISHPAPYLALDSVEDARQVSDGTVILASFGTTRLYVVARATHVACDDDTLGRAARELAEIIGGEDPRGDPAARYLRIPLHERVWNMDRGQHRHTRLDDKPWTADSLRPFRQAIRQLLGAGRDRIEGDR